MGSVMKKYEVRGHWILLLLGALTLVLALLLNTLTSGGGGESSQHRSGVSAEQDEPPAALPRSGPVLSPTDTGIDGATRPADKTIALTFDGGPDPQWTPQLLDVLHRHNARATFFAAGAAVAENPALVRRMVREGHELGNHTYTNLDKEGMPDWRIRLELDFTERALATAAGVYTRLARIPRSSTLDEMTGVAGDAGGKATGISGRPGRPRHAGLGRARGGGDRQTCG